MTSFRVILIPADTTKPLEERTVQLGEDRIGDELRFLQKLVGGYVERVVSRKLVQLADRTGVSVERHEYPCMLVNEEGLLMNLPINPRASRFYDGYPLHLIAGDAVLIWQSGPDWRTLPESVTVDTVGEAHARLWRAEQIGE